MEQAVSLERFLRAPVGKWIVAGLSVVWCHSPTLCGSFGWGRPDANAMRATLRAYEGYRRLAPEFDVLTDGSALEGWSEDALFVLLEWMQADVEELGRRVRCQLAIMPPSVDRLTLSGIAPQIGTPFPIKFVSDAADAFAAVLPDGGAELAAEVTGIVAAVRGTSPLLIGLRSLLKDRDGRLSLDDAAHALGVSTRSLQRQLEDAGSSFRQELSDVRFERITRLLGDSDDKIIAIAAQLGMTKSALSSLVQKRTALKPSQYRSQLLAKRRS